MAKFAVHISHSGNKKLDFIIDTTYSVGQIKEQLYTLTGIPIDRQKLICASLWKGFLNNSIDLNTIQFKDGVKINLMGTADAMPTMNNVTFIEDLPQNEVAKVANVAPAGLVNLGNTCYCNALLQCFKCVPELKNNLSSISLPDPNNHRNLVTSFGNTLKEMAESTGAVAPQLFLTNLREVYPQFGEVDHGIPRQQDSFELYISLMETLVSVLTPINSLYDDLFRIEYDINFKCAETNEQQMVSQEVVRSLTCNIQGGVISEDKVDFIHQGIGLSLEADVDKFSNELGRNSVWHKSQKISSLPPYICVQMSRFFWKETPDSRSHQGVKCKILRPVTFQEKFDIYEFCNDNLKNIMKNARDIADQNSLAGGMETKSPIETDGSSLSSVGPLVPPNFDGTYELFGVVSHKGRSADSGHYIGWVKNNGSWYCCDDADVQECRIDHVLDLKGGVDADIAYLLFYKMKV